MVLVDASLPDMMARLRWQDRARLRLMQAAIPFGLPRWRGWCGRKWESCLAIGGWVSWEELAPVGLVVSRPLFSLISLGCLSFEYF